MMFTVLGGRGFVGTHLVRHLQAQGVPVWVPDRDDPRVFEQALGHLVYAAGLTADFRRRPLDTVQSHVGLLHEVLARARFDSLLYLSSTRVYAGQGNTDENSPLWVSPTRPDDLYNLSKLMGESMALHSGRDGVRVVRLSNVLGEEGMPADNFLPELVMQALAGHVQLRSALESEKDYVDVQDVAELLPQIAAAGQSRIYNLASGVNTSHRDWLEDLAALQPFDLSVIAGAPVVRWAPIQTRRLHDEFGFQPRAVRALLPGIVRHFAAKL